VVARSRMTLMVLITAAALLPATVLLPTTDAAADPVTVDGHRIVPDGTMTVTWTATDDASGLAGPPPPPVTVSGQGTSAATSALVCDVAGNCANASYPVRIDSQGPTVTVTGVADHAVYTLGAVPAAACVATDATTGVDANQAGAYAVTATARDRAGNLTAVVVRYEVHYRRSGHA
jgi:hypothetical protein